jgi:hypothetical protein
MADKEFVESHEERWIDLGKLFFDGSTILLRKIVEPADIEQFLVARIAILTDCFDHFVVDVVTAWIRFDEDHSASMLPNPLICHE